MSLPTLAEIEDEIDREFKSNDLTRVPFPQAAWYLLSYVEDALLVPLLRERHPSHHELSMTIDEAVNALKYSLGWLWNSSPRSGAFRQVPPDENYMHSRSLTGLAEQFLTFATVFPYHHREIIELKVPELGRLTASHRLAENPRYEAYDRLTMNDHVTQIPEMSEQIADMIADATTPKRNSFFVELSRNLISRVNRAVGGVYDKAFLLPDDWRFRTYSLHEFRSVFVTLTSIAMVWAIGRRFAIDEGCGGLGYLNSVAVFDLGSLRKRVCEYSGVNSAEVEAILTQLTYGAAGITNPDPALQPLIPLTRSTLALAPLWWLGLSPERNLCTLLNRLPGEREAYLRLVGSKEMVMRSNITSRICNVSWAIKHGAIPGSSDLDLDLGIIDPSERIALILELKWFIDPAEPAELIRRMEDLDKGVDQLRARVACFQGSQVAREWLGIGADFEVVPVLVSANWIGFARNESDEIPIIRERHFARQLETASNLRDLASWLREKRYLPVEDKHFQVVPLVSRVGRWSVEWYAFKPLIDGIFVPD